MKTPSGGEKTNPIQTQFQRIICSAGLVSFFAAIRAAAHAICPHTIFFADFQPIFLILRKKMYFWTFLLVVSP